MVNRKGAMTMANVEIFGFAPSTYTRSVLLIAREKGVPAVLAPLDFGADSHRAIHPFLKMPALRHGVVRLYETAAIAIYLDEAFPGPRLQPKAPAERALMWQWITSAVDYFYGPLVADTLGHDAKDPPLDPAPRNHVLDVLESGLGRAFLVGDAATIADFLVMPMLRFQIDAAPGENLLAKRPNLAAWLERMAARESFRTLVAA
jgi:glutathione S-transferase